MCKTVRLNVNGINVNIMIKKLKSFHHWNLNKDRDGSLNIRLIDKSN